VFNVNKLLQFFNRILLLSWSIKTLKNLFKPFFWVIETLKSVNKFKINIHLSVQLMINLSGWVSDTVDFFF